MRRSTNICPTDNAVWFWVSLHSGKVSAADANSTPVSAKRSAGQTDPLPTTPVTLLARRGPAVILARNPVIQEHWCGPTPRFNMGAGRWFPGPDTRRSTSDRSCEPEVSRGDTQEGDDLGRRGDGRDDGAAPRREEHRRRGDG